MIFSSINIDNFIGKKIVNTEIFKNTNPNIVTLFGIILNLVIYFLLKNGSIFFGNIVCFIRCLTDILDGNIARKYNKTSKLGGFLDTLCDFMLIQVYIILFSCKYTDNPIILLLSMTLFGSLNIYFMRNSLTDHSNLEKTDNLIEDFILILFKNNTVILYLFLVYFNTKLFKKIDK